MSGRSRVLVGVLALAGCTHTAPLDPAAVGQRTGPATSWWRAASVTLDSGERHAARALHVAPDVTTWIDPETGEARSAPTAEVACVRLRSRARGALEGGAIGAVAGAMVGGVFGAAFASVAEDDTWTDGAYVWAGAGLSAMSWGLMGGGTGAVWQSRAVYVAPGADAACAGG